MSAKAILIGGSSHLPSCFIAVGPQPYIKINKYFQKASNEQ